MTDIRTMVFVKASTIADRVFFNKAPRGTAFPYVIFSFPDEGRAYHQQIEKMLQIRIYDHEKDGYNCPLEIEAITDNLEAGFDYKTASHDTTTAWFRKIGRNEIPFPEDDETWGRELLFEMKNYKLGV